MVMVNGTCALAVEHTNIIILKLAVLCFGNIKAAAAAAPTWNAAGTSDPASGRR